jgi:hypothetical protein
MKEVLEMAYLTMLLVDIREIEFIIIIIIII